MRVSRNSKYIAKVLDLARQLSVLADEGEVACDDDGCAVLYGIVRDCAYKIRGRAENERELHEAREAWKNERKAQ